MLIFERQICTFQVEGGFLTSTSSVDVDDSGVVDMTANIAGAGVITEQTDNNLVTVNADNTLTIDTVAMRVQQITESTVTLNLNGTTLELTFNVELRIEDLDVVSDIAPTSKHGFLFRKGRTTQVERLIVTAEGQRCFVEAKLSDGRLF